MVVTTGRQQTLFNDERSIDERFADFHNEHPEIYDQIVALCRRRKQRGLSHWRTKAAIEVVRDLWERRARRPLHGINDHFSSRYARLIMENEADLRGFFELRKLRS